MVSIEKKDLLELDRVGAGNFGTIYRNGDVVYKIYHEVVKTEFETFVKNPSLRLDKSRINRLMKLDKKLLYTDLVKDIVLIDGKFGGVVLPYYDGDTLIKTLDSPICEKFETAYQLVRNSKELTDNNIYPFDYKLNNIMLVDGNVKFIDLDDYFTMFMKFAYPFRTKEVVKTLDETIKKYFNDVKVYPFSKKFIKLLSCDDRSNTSYKDLADYITKKSKKHSYIFINDDTDVYKNISLLKNPNYRNIYVYSGCDNEFNERKIIKIINNGIDIYDAVSASMMRPYMRSIMYDECIGIKRDKVLNLKRK